MVKIPMRMKGIMVLQISLTKWPSLLAETETKEMVNWEEMSTAELGDAPLMTTVGHLSNHHQVCSNETWD